jgi:hypothetical protein
MGTRYVKKRRMAGVVTTHEWYCARCDEASLKPYKFKIDAQLAAIKHNKEFHPHEKLRRTPPLGAPTTP